jgi:hypothetical protein
MPPTVAAIHAHLWIAAAVHADLWIAVLAAHLPHTVCHTPHAIVQQVLRIRRRLFENRGRAEGWMCWKIFPRIWRRRGGHGRERKRRDGGEAARIERRKQPQPCLDLALEEERRPKLERRRI